MLLMGNMKRLTTILHAEASLDPVAKCVGASARFVLLQLHMLVLQPLYVGATATLWG
jgi:hypothetical protein